jgi:hypothetical protein
MAPRTNASGVTEVASIRTDMDKYYVNYDRIFRKEVMNKYVDKYGRYHDKPCTNGAPSSNNGWIYSAYAEKIGLELNLDNPYMYRCWHQRTRHIDDFEPPMSRDEMLGFAYLGNIDLGAWNFSPWALPKFNFIEFCKQLWECRNQDRNYFWKNKLTQVYHVAFITPLQDRAYYYRTFGVRPPYFYTIIEFIDKKLKPKSNSGALIRWLKYDIDPGLKVFEEYFGKEHPIYMAAKAKLTSL